MKIPTLTSENLRHADQAGRDAQTIIRERLGIPSADDDPSLDDALPTVPENGREITDHEITHRDRLRKYRIATDTVIPNSEKLPEDQRAAIRWLHQYALDNDTPLAELAQLLRHKSGAPYDANTVYRALAGKRENASLANITESIHEFRKKLDDGFTLDRPEFISTRLTKRLFKIFEAARLYKKIIFVFSDGQVGKTFGAEEFHRQNAGQTIYIRLPAGANKRAVLRHIAQILGFDDTASNTVLQERICNCFTPTMLIIWDEFHQTFTGRFQIETIEILREIFDRSKCGMVFISTKIVEDQFLRGKHKKVLSQMSRRAIAKISLPAIPAKAELDSFSAAYGLPPATGDALNLQISVINDQDHGGLGVWCTYLQAGCHVAAKRKQKLAWHHVIDGFKGLKALEQLKDLED
jgi:DNA transposition AAA+ family ATPase